MDWSKTKTIFIITFLLLNIFLGMQISEKRDNNRLEFISEASIEEQFVVDEISYGELPKSPVKESYISGKSYRFTEEDVTKLVEKEQMAEIVQETKIVGMFKEPIPVSETNLTTQMNQLLKDQILYGNQYTFWGYSEESNTLTFFQNHNNELIYSNESGMLRLMLDEENNILSYEQTLITELEEMDEAKELITAFDALENLYNFNELTPGSEAKVEFGYFTLVQYANSHVLTPTWHIVVNDEQDFFVNAFEGQIIRKENRTLE
ncbi:two-component system regulatory protein YycI [Sutcliffiella deserti]|uniref:two-component system regulatory protein YycI n=1 Tax=Sutcliffiella deserti TaxID=2875501 RepID=UPI001CBD6F9C|nr:two-component system regulatory protein YycI [Sutcliffiella deserti]